MSKESEQFKILKELIIKYELKPGTTFIEGEEKDHLMFGSFVKGHPMLFEGNFQDLIKDLETKINKNFTIAKSIMFDDSYGLVALQKRRKSEINIKK